VDVCWSRRFPRKAARISTELWKLCQGKDLIGNPVGRSVFLQLARKLLLWKYFLQLVRKKS
jgi:hypothetical protein